MCNEHHQPQQPHARRSHVGVRRALLLLACACFVAHPVAAQCIVSTLAGGGTSGSFAGAQDGVGTAALFSSPWGVVLGADGTLFVADYNNHKIRRVAQSGAVTTLAGGGLISNLNLTGSIDGLGSAALFFRPNGVTVDKNGTLWVADQGNNKIRRVSLSGAVTTLAGGNATGVQGGSVDGQGTAALFNLPRGITIDSNGTLYVADANNNKIRRITQSGIVTTLAGGNATGVLTGYKDGIGTAALFFWPYGISIDASGALFVADTANNKLRRIIVQTGAVTTVAGGIAGLEDGVGTAALFNLPRGIVVDASGTLWVADGGNSKLRRITPSGVVTTAAGGGSSGVLDGKEDGMGTGALFNTAHGVSVDANGTLYMTDNVNNRLRRLSNCTLCAAGNFCPTGSPDSAQLCPPGHYCPAGSTRWSDKNCGRGSYCPWGSSEPTSCGPKGVVNATLGPANGPAFSTEVASCRNHCFFGAPGQLSTCG